MVSAKDVAAKLGISVSTVGRAMSDDSRISQSTKEKVRTAAEQLGYVGNLAARMMRGESSNSIALILPDIGNDFYASIAHELSECCDKQGYRLALSLTGDDPGAEARQVRQFVEAGVAGLIIVPTSGPRKETVSILSRVPHVQLLRHITSLGDIWFGIDDKIVMEKAAAYLVSQGHKNIVYIGGSEQLSTGRARLAGVKAAISQANDVKLEVRVGPPTFASGANAVSDIMAGGGTNFTAILTGSVHVTLGVLKACHELRVDVPQDLSIVGFGDPIWYEWWGPGLTTVRPPIAALARSCGLWFLDQLSSDTEWQNELHRATSESSLIIRGSVAKL